MKKYILLLYLGLTATLNAQEIQLNVDYIEQEKTKWCGAAAAKCVFDYYKILNNQSKKYSQCAIMEYVRCVAGSYYGYSGCCTPDPPGFEHPCNKDIALGLNDEKGSIKAILMNLGNIPCVKKQNPLNPYDIENSITQNRLLVASLKYHFPPYGSPEAHAVVIHGIKNQNLIYSVYYMDPSPYDPIYQVGGKRELPLTEFCNNEKWWWTGTLGVTDCSRSDYPCHCYNGIFEPELGEKGYDCGGPCPDCTTPPPPPPTWHCYNRKQDADLGETGVDCGGPCPQRCEDLPPCANCKRDDGEVLVDCGGTCGSCYDVLDEVMITNTAQLYIDYNIYNPNNKIRSEIMAFNKITAKDATTVKSGEKISFITEEEGSIILLPGFKVEKGANFSTQRKDLSGSSRICGEVCRIEHLSYEHSVSYGHFLTVYGLYNAVEIEYRIHYYETGEIVYENSLNITNNGNFKLWDCKSGTINPKGTVWYYIVYYVFYCNGSSYSNTSNTWKFNVYYPSNKSPNDDPDDPETPDTYSPPTPNTITPQDNNVTPNFVIIPNPNLGTFQLETNFPLSDIEYLKITNLLGIPVYEAQNPTSNTIQLPATASGQHFVVLMLKNGKVLTQKMMVQR